MGCSDMEWYRNIKRYVSGDDVKYAKDKLVELGYLYASTKKRFGDDSYRNTNGSSSTNYCVPVAIYGVA